MRVHLLLMIDTISVTCNYMTLLCLISVALKLHKTCPYKEQSVVLPMEVVNETITMDTPQQEASEAINSLVT